MVILAGDHIYKMDYESMLREHVETGADVTVGCLEVPRMEATGFGVMHVDTQDRIVSFVEKPADPPGMPDKPDFALASMGIYVFRTSFLMEELRRDASQPGSNRDFGKDIIPHIVANGKAVAHRFSKSCVRSNFETESYWRDVGTVDAYWEANIDLTDITPELDLYDRDWPIWTYAELKPPATAARPPEARSSLYSCPGSRRCACTSISPGTTHAPSASRTSAPSSGIEFPLVSSAAMRPSSINIEADPALASRSQLGSRNRPFLMMNLDMA